MTAIRIAHFSDLHYCPEHLEEVDRCFSSAIEDAANQKCDVAVISGDLTDHRIDFHSPAALALTDRIVILAKHMPVLILQGTFSHDPAGSVAMFQNLDADNPIHVADSIHQVALCKRGANGRDWWWSNDANNGMARAVFSCLPTVPKGHVAARVGAEKANQETAELVYDLLLAWALPNEELLERGIPTIGVAHGTVKGSVTEHGVPMAGKDHEMSPAGLFHSRCRAFLLGHIHKYQSWEMTDEAGRQLAAYAGSIGRLHFGEEGPKGWLLWDVTDRVAEARLMETPAKQLVHFNYEGAPPMDELDKAAKEIDYSKPTHVRVRWTIDEEHRHLVDHKAIKAVFEKAVEVKLEPRVVLIQRTRTEGITKAAGIGEKLVMWAELAECEPGPLLERLELLENKEPGEIVSTLTSD